MLSDLCRHRGVNYASFQMIELYGKDRDNVQAKTIGFHNEWTPDFISESDRQVHQKLVMKKLENISMKIFSASYGPHDHNTYDGVFHNQVERYSRLKHNVPHHFDSYPRPFYSR